ncbi:MAG TPA: class I SAM-dependent methyltransferase [Candidatus Saccharimonadales bacterium]|nr:class I SAM-dependent methyltransferase [Candidatus Saccharimonadales bacterium]
MRDFAKANVSWWDEVTPVHSNSKLYDLAGFKKGKSSLQSIEAEELGNVKGKSLLHLMCHFGMDSLSFARNGAKVTGVDFSPRAIELGKKLSSDLDIPAQFVCSDVYKLPRVLDKKFDIVFASYGVLCWLPDIEKFAHIVSSYLKKGGIFYMAELHPFCSILSSDFKIYYKYFDKGPYLDDSTGTYTDWSAPVKGKTYEWSYTIGDVINALIKQGLKIEFVHEFPFSMYDQFPGFMRKNKKGQYVLKNKKIQIPLLFSLKARK